MAKQQMVEPLTLPAGADLSSDQFKYVKLNSSGQVVLAGDGEYAVGVLMNKPSAAGQAAEVAPLSQGSIYKVAAGGALATIGTELASDATGRAAAAATGERLTGIQLSVAGGAGEVIEVLNVTLGRKT